MSGAQELPTTAVAVDQLLESIAAYDKTHRRATYGMAKSLEATAKECAEVGDGPQAVVWARMAVVVMAVGNDQEPVLHGHPHEGI